MYTSRVYTLFGPTGGFNLLFEIRTRWTAVVASETFLPHDEKYLRLERNDLVDSTRRGPSFSFRLVRAKNPSGEDAVSVVYNIMTIR